MIVVIVVCCQVEMFDSDRSLVQGLYGFILIPAAIHS